MSEIAALGLLLDQTYDELAAAGRRPRHLDRELLIGRLDAWDNHLLPAVAAAARVTPWGRRRAARAVWRSLGATSNPARRAWLADHLVSVGLDPETVLGPALPALTPYLDYDQRIQPVEQPVTTELARLVDADYDFAGGRVEHARLELDPGQGDRMRGALVLSAPRRTYTELRPTGGDDPGSWAQLRFDAADVTSFAIPHVDRAAAGLVGQPTITVTPDRTTVAAPLTGAEVSLTGPEVRYLPRDIFWYESAAAAATTLGPERSVVEVPARPGLTGDLATLAQLQHNVLLRLRMMRYPDLLRRQDLEAAGTMGAGLGSATIEAAGGRPAAATAVLTRLIDGADDAARTLLAEAAWDLDLSGLIRGRPGPVVVPITAANSAHLLSTVDFTGGRVRFLDLSTDHRPGEPDRTVLHLDVRSAASDRDTIVVMVLAEPRGGTTLPAAPGGLDLAGAPVIVHARDGLDLIIPLVGGRWTIEATTGTWYAD